MKRLLAVILALCLIPGMVVYGSDVTDVEETEVTEDIASPEGIYKLTGLISESGDSLSVVSTAIDLGVNFYLILNGDGTGAMSFLEANIPLTWDDSCIIIPFGGDIDDKYDDYDEYDDDDDEYDDDDDDEYDDDDDDEFDDDDDDEYDDLDDDGPIMIPYQYSDGFLKIRTQAYSMDFISLSGEERADFEENGDTSLSGLAGVVIEGLINSLGIGDLVESLIFELAFGSMEPSPVVPIPEGEPSEGPVTGVVGGMEFTILGAEIRPMSDEYYTADKAYKGNEEDDSEDEDDIDDEDEWVITFYFDARNISDETDCTWWYSYEADNDWDEEFIDWAFLYLPEESSSELRVAPGGTIRGASSFVCEPDDGVIGFRISAYNEEESVTYYVDPLNPGDAPEPFDYHTNPSVSEFLEELPEENDEIHAEKVEFYTTEDGKEAVRFYYTFRNASDTACTFVDRYDWYAMQDCVEVPWIRDAVIEEEENYLAEVAPGEEILCAASFEVRTDSPVAFVVIDVNDETPYLSWMNSEEE